MTKMSDIGLYDFLRYYYNSDLTAKRNSRNMFPKNFNLSVQDLFRKGKHEFSDLIFSCTWAGVECQPSQFVETLTDYGTCYTFNSARSKNLTELLTVTESGMNNALSLVLNIEQYEYMASPDNDAGIKMFLHNDYTRPLMSDLGFAIPSGMHTLVGVKRIESYSLSEPYGLCVDSKYKSHAECVYHCRIKIVSERCDCIPFESLEVLGYSNKTVCSALDNIVCVDIESIHVKKEKNLCKCSVPCKQIIFDPSLSFSTVSRFSADRLTFSNKKVKKKLEQSKKKALEYSEIIFSDKKQRNIKLIESFSENFNEFSGILTKNMNFFKVSKNISSPISDFHSSFKKNVINLQENFWKISKSFTSQAFHRITTNLNILRQNFQSVLTGIFNNNKFAIADAISDVKKCIVNEENNNEENYGSLYECIKFSDISVVHPSIVNKTTYTLYWNNISKEKDARLFKFKFLNTIDIDFSNEIQRIFGYPMMDPNLDFFKTECLPKFSKLKFFFNNLNVTFTNIEITNELIDLVHEINNLLVDFKSLGQILDLDISDCFLKSFNIHSENIEFVKNNLMEATEEVQILQEMFSSKWNEMQKTLNDISILSKINNNLELYKNVTNYNSSLTKFKIANDLINADLIGKISELIDYRTQINFLSGKFAESNLELLKFLKRIDDRIAYLYIYPKPEENEMFQIISYKPINFDIYINKYKSWFEKNVSCIIVMWISSDFYDCVFSLSLAVEQNLQADMKKLRALENKLRTSSVELERHFQNFVDDATIDDKFFM